MIPRGLSLRTKSRVNSCLHITPVGGNRFAIDKRQVNDLLDRWNPAGFLLRKGSIRSYYCCVFNSPVLQSDSPRPIASWQCPEGIPGTAYVALALVGTKEPAGARAR